MPRILYVVDHLRQFFLLLKPSTSFGSPLWEATVLLTVHICSLDCWGGLLLTRITANTLLELAEPIRFIGKITTMGDRKVIIYIPQDFHSQVKKSFKGKQVKVTIEDAI